MRKFRLVLLLLVAVVLLSGCIMGSVDPDEGAVIVNAGRLEGVVGPGFQFSLNPVKTMHVYKRSALNFCVTDPEILTRSDAQEGQQAGLGQSIGLQACADVFRPGPEDSARVENLWVNYRGVFDSDEALIGSGEQLGLMQRLAKQAMKVCVGQRTFEQAVVGTARDELRQCIDSELSALAENYGLDVQNVVVPEVILTPDQQQILQEIGSSKFRTEQARQREREAVANAQAEAARQRGEIEVEQARIQEKLKQDAITAELRAQALAAERAAIEADKSNAIYAAEQDLKLAELARQKAEVDAQAKLAPELARAQMYGANPAYVDLLIQQAWANAYRQTDKVGANPQVILSGQAPVPTLDVGGETP